METVSKPDLTLVIGNRGTGKTSFLVYQGRRTYFERGELLKRRSIAKVEQLNKDLGRKLTPPDDVPIFTSPKLKMKFVVGWYKYFTPYLANPYYIGTCDDSGKPAMFTPPGSVFFMPEFHEVINSRKSMTMPDRLSKWFAESRHWDIEFWGDGQRGDLMDKNVRGIADKIIEMQGVENELDKIGRVKRTVWNCREFANLRDFDNYKYVETTYEYKGNIFECYDSKQGKIDFIPPKGQDFTYKKHLTDRELSELPEADAALYSMIEPKWFRGNSDV